HEGDRELILGGDPLRDALIDLSQRGRHNVELALARLWFFALGFHASPAVERVLRRLRRDTELSVEAIPALGHYHPRSIDRAAGWQPVGQLANFVGALARDLQRTLRVG